ncbi:hypothetical protein [Leuconostoc lactis]|uniref:hypothetical protein n=1 Tax=Leuconostoc lactis TaxID=1246 RepID=UPI00289DD045|nr:hypothetical protein [Leuconostoc lactis]
MKISRNEQETIIVFDVEVGKWHIDTTYPPHIRKYKEVIGKIEEETQDRLSGWLADDYSGSFSARKRRELTDEQRSELSERAKSRFGSKYKEQTSEK